MFIDNINNNNFTFSQQFWWSIMDAINLANIILPEYHLYGDVKLVLHISMVTDDSLAGWITIPCLFNYL